jgi:hypothetical protein
MPRNFYFRKDADAVAGSANFASLISTGFSGYGITPDQSAAFGLLNAALRDAWSAAAEPSTRTRVAVAAKNLAVRNMRAGAILLSKIIYATPTVTDAQLVGLGLLPRRTHTRVGPPTTAPVVEVGVVSGRLVNVRLRPSDSRRRGIEAGARGANLYSFVGPDAPADARDYRFEGMTTRAIAQVLFPGGVPSGATVWLSARWVNNRGQTGPASAPVSFALQGGAALPAEAA